MTHWLAGSGWERGESEARFRSLVELCSFVMSAARSQESRTAIRSIIERCHSLDMRATAEGVEDAEALEYLVRVGCDYAQGYFIAHPMPGDAIAHWLAGRSGWGAGC